MPNALAHLGVHAVLTRSVVRNADEKWIYIGAVLPDIGWIVHRVARDTLPDVDAYDLRLYAIAQTSLMGTLLLALALSLCSRRAGITLAILCLNAVIHLLLDACEIKWGNGVVLFAPLHWGMLNWGQFWPEQWPAHLLTLFGLVYVIATLHRTTETPLDLSWSGLPRALLAAGLIMAYFVIPWTLRQGPLDANLHYVRVLRDPATRPGSYVEFDRERFIPVKNGGTLEFFAPQPVSVTGIDLSDPSTVSLRGRFIDSNTIEVLEFRAHRGPSRSLPTLLGLTLILGLIAAAWQRGRSRR